jgi:acetoin utilization protein AcuB
MKTIPSVRKYMTTTPSALRPEDTLAHAHSLMKELKIRHLPVCEGDRVVGLLSDNDLFRAESLHDADPNKLKAKDVMSLNPYAVSPDAPLDEVVQEMASKKMGSALVVDNHKVVGVFTATDALSAFAELLHTRLG